MEFLNLFIKWQKKKYSQAQKLLFSITIVPTFFFVVIPVFASWLSGKIDKALVLPSILASPLNFYIGVIFFIFGLFLFGWTVLVFYQVGRGTPSPIIPTQKLVIDGPYAYCRNPMYLGVVVWIYGLGVILNSISFIFAGFIIPSLYLIYVKLVEEKELEKRFGKKYLEYKKKVPFLIPTFRKIDKS
ncbi:isoprenylcysteine carboxylmethyltransferase family protein [Candidatus Curtissbacteria bacterium]|nr:isoprenylcysteine carboxylmethyltransferase family protein [Candidatus Curtissbacteria bacterium]